MVIVSGFLRPDLSHRGKHESMSSGCTLLSVSQETKLESSGQEASSSAGTITGVLLILCRTWKNVPKAISDGIYIPEVPGCHLVRQMSCHKGSQ